MHMNVSPSEKAGGGPLIRLLWHPLMSVCLGFLCRILDLKTHLLYGIAVVLENALIGQSTTINGGFLFFDTSLLHLISIKSDNKALLLNLKFQQFSGGANRSF